VPPVDKHWKLQYCRTTRKNQNNLSAGPQPLPQHIANGNFGLSNMLHSLHHICHCSPHNTALSEDLIRSSKSKNSQLRPYRFRHRRRGPRCRIWLPRCLHLKTRGMSGSDTNPRTSRSLIGNLRSDWWGSSKREWEKTKGMKGRWRLTRYVWVKISRAFCRSSRARGNTAEAHTY
jgi:hypothetical protein